MEKSVQSQCVNAQPKLLEECRSGLYAWRHRFVIWRPESNFPEVRAQTWAHHARRAGIHARARKRLERRGDLATRAKALARKAELPKTLHLPIRGTGITFAIASET